VKSAKTVNFGPDVYYVIEYKAAEVEDIEKLSGLFDSLDIDEDLCIKCGCCRYAHFLGGGKRSGECACMFKKHKCVKGEY